MVSKEKPEPRERSGSAVVVILLLAGLFALPMAYCLSLGPVVWLIEKQGVDSSYFQTIYAPLDWLHSHVEWTRPLLEWYVGLWSD